MADAGIKAQLKQMIVERLFLKVKPDDIEDTAPLMPTYNIDSVQLFELVVGLEDLFGITFEEDDFSVDLFENVDSIAEFVERKKGAPS
jgi:acyl carrier protein